MTVKAGWSTPMLHVCDVPRSIAFYRKLGFQLADIGGDDGGVPGWARLSMEDGSAIMLLRLEDGHRIDPGVQGVMLVLYSPDLAGLRDQLLAGGESPGPIEAPPWMPSGTFLLQDPDGYRVGVNHWGEREDREWLAHRERKRAEGRVD